MYIYIYYEYYIHTVITTCTYAFWKPTPKNQKSCSKWKGDSNILNSLHLYLGGVDVIFRDVHYRYNGQSRCRSPHLRWVVELWSFLSNRENWVSKCHLLWRWGQFGVPKACAKKCWFGSLPLASVEGQQGLLAHRSSIDPSFGDHLVQPIGNGMTIPYTWETTASFDLTERMPTARTILYKG